MTVIMDLLPSVVTYYRVFYPGHAFQMHLVSYYNCKYNFSFEEVE